MVKDFLIPMHLPVSLIFLLTVYLSKRWILLDPKPGVHQAGVAWYRLNLWSGHQLYLCHTPGYLMKDSVVVYRYSASFLLSPTSMEFGRWNCEPGRS